MEQTTLLIDRFKELPENMRYQVLDFIEFLIIKYEAEKREIFNSTELTEAQKQTLDKRYKTSQEKPESRIPWNELKEELFERFKPAQTV